LLHVHDANGVVTGVRRVKLLQFGDVFDAFRPRSLGNSGDDFVRGEVDHICLPGSEMRGNQIVVVRIDGEIVKALS